VLFRELGGLHGAEQAEAISVGKEMVKKEPEILDPSYYNRHPACGPFHGQALTPLREAVSSPSLLKALLTSGSKHLKEAIEQVSIVRFEESNLLVAGTPLQFYARLEKWEHCRLLLTHARPKVLTSAAVPEGMTASTLPCAHEMIMAGCSEKENRLLRALVEGAAMAERKAAAAKERASKAAAAAKEMASKASAVGASTNAFEGPAAKVSTATEETKKAKKREAKKRARAKKREKAKSGEDFPVAAGAGEAPLDDSDSSGSDDEEGMDGEERMLARAPTFDLQKEKAARRARAEAEAAEWARAKEKEKQNEEERD
jgi:hypothetical protein